MLNSFVTASCLGWFVYDNILHIYMRLYDVVLVFRTGVAETARDKRMGTIKEWLGKAKVAKVVDWGNKKLSYPIKRETEGNYVILEIESENGIMPDFEKKLLMEEGILRHLVIRKH